MKERERERETEREIESERESESLFNRMRSLFRDDLPDLN
jgi:hypothetical protein